MCIFRLSTDNRVNIVTPPVKVNLLHFDIQEPGRKNKFYKKIMVLDLNQGYSIIFC